jgi:RHS repeat-associated protein
LSGLSSITRSSKTRAQDETADANQQTKAVSLGINHAQSDRFSLDGERLVLTPESSNTAIPFDDNYGSDLTTYYTEQNSFTRVQLIGANLGTQYFKAYTKSGLIFEYGNTSTSRVVDPTKNVAFQWLVNRIEDRKGNYMTFSYLQDPTTGEVYPDKIEYTGNTAGGLTPYNKIQFIWETRPDRSGVYGIRYQRKNTYQKRLQSVQVFYQTTLVRQYKLSYISSTSSQYSLLDQVQECDGSSPQLCLEPTKFEWSNIELGLGTPVEITSMPGTADKRVFGDFNGDGFTDIATWDIPTNTANVVIQFYLNDGNGNFTLSSASGSTTSIGGGEQLRIQTGEFNGDNINDILVTWRPLPNPAVGNNCLFLISNPPVPNAGAAYTYPCTYYIKFGRVGDTPFDDFVVDLNQDGISDFVDYQNEAGTFKPILTEARIAVNLPTNSATAQPYYGTVNQAGLSGYNLSWSSTSDPEESFEDINDDGLTDLFVVDKNDGKNLFIFTDATRTVADAATRKNQFRATNSTYVRSLLDQSWLAGAANKISLTDLNSDNLPDVLVVKPGSNQVVIIPNKGDKGFEVLANHITYTVAGSIITSFSNVFPNDFNADGLVDLTFYETVNGTSRTYLNQGEFGFNFSAPLADVWPSFRFKDTGTNPRPQVGNFLKASHSDLLYFNPANSKYYVQRMRQSQGVTIKKITNGAGLATEIRYDNLLNSAFYEKAGQVTFPNVDIQSALYMVSKIKTITTTGDETAKKYQYCGATINVEGRGFRGFTKIIERDTITGIYDARYYRQGDDQWKYTGETVIKTERFYANDVLIARTSHNPVLISYPNNAYAKCFHAYAKEEITEDFVNNKTQTVRKLNDSYGNPTYVTVDFGQGFRDSTVNVYTDNLTNWLLGRLTQATVYRFATGHTTEVRQATFEYDGATGLLTKETSDANLAADKRVVKTYTYDTFGNITQSNTNAWTGSVFQDRTVQTTYDALTKRFVVQTTNPLGHTATATYEQKFGLPLIQTDPNSLTVGYQYDGFSRPTKQTMPDGTWKAIAYRKASVATFQSPTEAVFLTYTQSSNGQLMVEHYDSYNRGVQTKSKGFDGRWVLVDHTFSRVTSPDVREIIKNNFPYYEGETSTGYSQKELDKLGRVVAVRETKTGGVRTATTEYGGLITEFTNFKNQKKIDVDDVKDRIVESRWNNGNNVFFTYDAAGRLLTTKDLKGNTITNEYDARGFKTRMNDPDMGIYQYEYNGFGELTKQTYPNGNVVTMTYDKLGRMLTRVDVDGTTTNTYDTGNKAIGKLSRVTGYVSTHTFSYDNLGRKSQETTAVNSQTYITAYTYDAQGRLNTLSYPATGLVLKNVYNNYGFLSELQNNADQSLFWRLNTMDAKGNILLQEYGNGVKTEQQFEAATQYLQSIRSYYNSTTLQQFSFTFNDLAHLVERKDEKRGNTESFAYDDVNRLVETKLNGTTTTTLQYDVLGNITYKSDVGDYEYGTVNNGPHRLLNVRTNNANVQCSFTLNIDTKYTSFNKVKEISNDTARVEVFYGPDQQRIMQKMYVRGTLTRTKLYIGGITEIEIFSNGKTKTTNFIGGVAMQVTEKQGAAPAVTTLKYYLKDHLGSNTGFTGAGGVLLEELSFDAWGQRRNADWTASTTVGAGSHERGFTNHEHYDLFAMIDMNGRVYDPVLGRFLQPDPFIQDMTDLQALNRYSYVGNNPLSFTDPSGYFFKKTFRAIGRAVGRAVEAVTSYVKENWKPLVAIAVQLVVTYVTSSPEAGAFAKNFTATLLNGDNLKSALKSGFRGAVSKGLLDELNSVVGEQAGTLSQNASILETAQYYGIKIIGEGVIQGANSWANDRNFSEGFFNSTIPSITEATILNFELIGIRKGIVNSIGKGLQKGLTGGEFKSTFINRLLEEKDFGLSGYASDIVDFAGFTGNYLKYGTEGLTAIGNGIVAGSLRSAIGQDFQKEFSERIKSPAWNELKKESLREFHSSRFYKGIKSYGEDLKDGLKREIDSIF